MMKNEQNPEGSTGVKSPNSNSAGTPPLDFEIRPEKITMFKPNGCGPDIWPGWIKIILFNWFFEASCDKHDIGYVAGGDEARRLVCDRKFLRAMLRDVLRLLMAGSVFAPFAFITALGFYAAVRLGGKSSFNYQ